MMNKKYFGIVLILLLAFLLNSCDNPFQFSLYDAETSDSDLNQKNIDLLTSNFFNKDTLVFAAFADSHNYYSYLHKAVKAINSRNDIEFVVVAGDVTETGLANQYEAYLYEVKNLNVPYITIIGNHDFLSNGGTIYKKIFGPTNFSFEYAGYRFIGFNDNVWENNNTPPDFNWLKNALPGSGKKSIVIAHIQPWTDAQLGDEYSNLYHDIISNGNTILSIGGHCHGFDFSITDNINYLIAGSVTTGGVSIIKIYDGGKVKIERMNI